MNVDHVVEAALRSSIGTEAITDIESADIAVTQLALLSELPKIEGGCQTPGADGQGSSVVGGTAASG